MATISEREKLDLQREDIKEKINSRRNILLRGCAQSLATKLRADINEMELRLLEIEERILSL